MTKIDPEATDHGYLGFGQGPRLMVDLSVNAGRAALRSCEARRMPRGDGDYPSLEILYEGRWREVGSTDLVDDVRRGTVLWEMPSRFETDPLGYYECQIAYGVRVSDGGFFCVGAYSDG